MIQNSMLFDTWRNNFLRMDESRGTRVICFPSRAKLLFSGCQKTRDKSLNTRVICFLTSGKLLFSDALKTMNESQTTCSAWGKAIA